MPNVEPWVTVFRADASHRIGTGHVKRCLVLARAIKKRGGKVFFISRPQPGDLTALCREEGFDVCLLPPPPDTKPSSEDDAKATAELLQTFPVRPDWLILDQYELGLPWERSVRPHVSRILVLDGQGTYPHECDILLNPNPAPESVRGSYRLNAECEPLMGLDYFLLDERFEEFSAQRRVRNQTPRRILITCGGADEPNDTLKTISALLARGRMFDRIDVVLGPNYLYEQEARRIAAGAAEISLHRNLVSLAPLMAAADLAVTAGGGTKYELCYMGVPSLVLIAAENQRLSSEWMASQGMIHLLGSSGEVDIAGIGAALDDLCAAPHKMRSLSEAALKGIDGNGVSRVLEAMIARDHSPQPSSKTGN